MRRRGITASSARGGTVDPRRRCNDMTRLAVAVILLAACAPAVTPSQAPLTPSPVASETVATMALPTSAPPVATPVPTPLPTPVATPLATPSVATPVARPTEPPTPPPTPLGPVRHEGQKIVATPEALAWTMGEAGGSPATQIANYRLNGESLAGSSLMCTSLQTSRNLPPGCSRIEIIPRVHLVNGQRYELSLLDMPIGAFVAQGLVVATPHVVSVTATQYQLAVRFDRAMLHAGICGSSPWTLSVPGTISFVRSAGGVPAAPGGYTSSTAAYRDFLASFVSEATVSADCMSVTFGSGWGGPTGDIDVTVSGVVDADGNAVQPRTFSLHIEDEGPPKLMFAQLELQTAEKKVIRVAYSEAMDETYVTDPVRYSLNGRPIPAGTTIECALAGCAWVRLTFAPTTFVYGAPNTLTITGVRDIAGNGMVPDIQTSGTFEVR